jgi:hypothetical protein
VVRCEECKRFYAYELERVGCADGLGFFGGPGAAAYRRAEEDLRRKLAEGVEAIPCPNCGRYQADMVPGMRRLHRRWMLYLGQCLTIGLVPAAVFGAHMILLEAEGLPSIPSPIIFSILSCIFLVGVYMLVRRGVLIRRYDPNDEDVEARKRYGRSRAILARDTSPHRITLDVGPDGGITLDLGPDGELTRGPGAAG